MPYIVISPLYKTAYILYQLMPSKRGGLSSPFVFQLFHVELITADRFVIYAWVAELVDARDLKSLGHYGCTSSILVPGTNKIRGL